MNGDTSQNNLKSESGGFPSNAASDQWVVMPPGMQPHSAAKLSQEHRAEQSDHQLASSLASVIQLISSINQADTLEQAADTASVMLTNWLQADQIVIAWQRRPASDCCLLIADHNAELTGNISHNSESRKALDSMCLAAAEEILTRDATTDSRATRRRDQASLLAVKQYAQATGARRILGVSFGTAFDDPQSAGGVVLARFQRTLSESEATQILNALDACRQPLFHALKKTAATELAPWLRRLMPWRTSEPHVRSQISRSLFAVVALMLVGVSMIPMNYQVPAECQLQPVGRRYVAAPDNGALQSVIASPGDDVRQGQLLARLDSREIEMEISAKHAELQRHQQEQKSELAEQNFAKSNLAALRVKRLQSEVDQLVLRRQQLDVTAPIDGVVVSGDWKSSEGTPVAKGDTLFEIAPPAHYRVELAISESDILHARTNMPLTIRLDALPSESMTANVLRVHPRSELRDNDNVFIAEAELDDPERRLRPGMRGRAHIQSDPHPIAWNLFHKATAALGKLWRN